ncbi:MAG: cob(I)yrinic acid a,c-diamide adenosyltransferase [Candidatus Limivivens sp.]|nr:cob(I)yrinic acid a,c-diamide adenosyltransferase [Candidatus Limivivens sp.]
MEKETGLIHIYYGNGKGKTTTGMGLITRAAGFGYRVLLYQFMKNNKTSERKILEQVPNITIVDGLDQEKFSFQMTEEEKRERRKFYNEQFQKVTRKAVEEEYDVLFLDEAIYTITAGLLDERPVLEFLARKPEKLEVILTGNTPSDKMIEAADYVSEIRKIKHPFDKGQRARSGIER